jgi:hypothetical protein
MLQGEVVSYMIELREKDVKYNEGEKFSCMNCEGCGRVCSTLLWKCR